MSDLNVSVFSGRVVNDADVTETSNGKKIARFSVAVQGRDRDDVSFIPISVFLKENDGRIKYLKKGQSVIVRGSLRQNRWKKDGAHRSALEISSIAISFVFGKQQEKSERTGVSGVKIDEIPFDIF